MKKSLLLGARTVLTALAFATFGSVASAIDPAGLKILLDRSEKITVIDVRSATLFQRDHIPGAINVPASLVPEKKLPALGRVIVCDEGLGRDGAGTTAARDLNKKTGIMAEVLEGGFAGWQALLGATTKGRGVHPEELTLMAYDQLKKSNPEEVVLVDLRKPRPQTRQGVETNVPALPPLTDLTAEFPQTHVTKSPFDLPQVRQSSSGKVVAPVLVLIDDGDGSAQGVARTLRANGVTRVVILAGGESILARHGQSGLQRSGGSLSGPGTAITNPGSK